MTGRHHDEDGDSIADQGLDAQARAFRHATNDDHVPDRQLHQHAEAVHEPITDLSQVRLPDDYEAGEGWDAGRQPPKTLDEARAALAARITDPTAPDGPESAGAYDGRDA